MENPQMFAAIAAGIIAPFLQEIFFGARVSGRIAVALNAAVSFILAAIAFWASGGFRAAVGAPAFDLLDPSAFLAFWWVTVFAPVFGLSQLVFNITTKRQPDITSGIIQSTADKVTEVAPAITGGGTP